MCRNNSCGGIDLTTKQKIILTGLITLVFILMFIGIYQYIYWNDGITDLGQVEIEIIGVNQEIILYKENGQPHMYLFGRQYQDVTHMKLIKGDKLTVNKISEKRGGFDYIRFPNLLDVIKEKIKDR